MTLSTPSDGVWGHPDQWVGKDARDYIERLTQRVAELEDALRFYANAEHYADWHDTGRTEKQTASKVVERWAPDGEDGYVYDGWEHEDYEFDAPLWLTTIGEDAGANARALLTSDQKDL